MKSVVAYFLVVTSLLFSSPVYSSEDPFLFGPEFTFSNSGITDNKWPQGIDRHSVERFWDRPDWFLADNADNLDAYIHLLVERMEQHLVHNQPKGSKFTFEKSSGIRKFTSPNGWSFSLVRDSGVIEVNMSPMTLDDYLRYKDDIQDAIFVSAANTGLFPFDYLGGGHISIGMEGFLEDPLLFRNFVVDFINHAELSLGVMSYDSHNALPVALLKPEPIEKIKKTIGLYDRMGMWDLMVGREFKPLGKDLDLAMKSYPIDDYTKQWSNRIHLPDLRGKRHALNLANMVRDNPGQERIEVRSIRPQKSMDVFIRQVSLLRGRLRYLKKLNKPIPLSPAVAVYHRQLQFPAGAHKLSPPIDAQLALKAFYRYVTEAGQKWEDHTDYLWPKWITDGEVEKFEKSLFFKSQQVVQKTRNSCRHLLNLVRP